MALTVSSFTELHSIPLNRSKLSVQPNKRPAFTILKYAFDSFETPMLSSQSVPHVQLTGTGAGAVAGGGAGAPQLSVQQLRQRREAEERTRLFSDGPNQLRAPKPLLQTPLRNVVGDEVLYDGVINQQPNQIVSSKRAPSGLSKRTAGRKMEQFLGASISVLDDEQQQWLHTFYLKGAHTSSGGTTGTPTRTKL